MTPIYLDELYEIVGRLIEINARHRSGVQMASVPIGTIINHIEDEIHELVHAFMGHDRDRIKDELCDVIGVVLHLAHKLDLPPAEIKHRCVDKFRQRFDKMPEIGDGE